MTTSRKAAELTRLRLGFQLTSIKNLLGRQGNHFLIFGLLARMEDGAFYLEDLDDKVELDLSEAVRFCPPFWGASY